MGSKAQDQSTQKQASAGATQQDTALAKNAQQNQAFSNQARQNLFGQTGTGGSMGGFLNPSSLNQTGLSGTYQNQFSNAANRVANTTQNALGTTMQSLANRGMGKSPAGFAADQQRKAYQDQAGQLGDLYTGAMQGQHGEALSNFWNAQNMLNSNASQTANLSLQGNQAAAGNYANLYGTSSQQVQNPWMNAAGAIAGLGTAASGFMPGKPPACWIAAELWGGWDDPRVSLVRTWIYGPFQRKSIGRVLGKLYLRFGERLAEAIKTNRPLRALMERVFKHALAAAKGE